MTAYYNEFDPFASAWLRNLVAAGHIARGDVDSRSIVDVQPEDLEGRDETHFFAGIGVWSRALRDAGWPTARVPIWSGSAPCQPFSAAGKQRGTNDERHLWPVWFRLVDECRPPVIVGEQVASKPALAWFDALCADLEGAGYSVGAVDMCAAGLGAPHIRQRLWWVAVRRDFDRLADAGGFGRHLQSSARVHGRWTGASGEESAAHGADGAQRNHDAGCGIDDRLADAGDGRCPLEQHTGCCDAPPRRGQADGQSSGAGTDVGLADADSDGPQRRVSGGAAAGRSMVRGSAGCDGATDGSGATNGEWGSADWIFCRDGRWRPVEPGTFPLAHGSAARVGRLRGYGNAIALPVATWWVSTVMDVLGLRGTP